MKYEKIYILTIKFISKNPKILEKYHEKYIFGYLKEELNDHLISMARSKAFTHVSWILSAAEKEGFLIELSRDSKQDKAVEYIYVDDVFICSMNVLGKFKVISCNEFLELLKKDGWKDKLYLDPVLSDISKEEKLILTVRIAALFVGFSLFLIAPFYNEITSYLPPIAVFFASGLFGIILYMFRCRQRSYYGAIEIIFGMLVATNFMFPIGTIVWSYFQMIGGVYIVVRGLDNISETEFGNKKIWKKFFPKQMNFQ